MGTAKRERQKTNRQERMQQVQRAQARRQTKRRGFVIGGFVVAFLLVAVIIAITTGGDDDDGEETTTETTTATGATTTAAGATTVPGETTAAPEPTSVPTVPGATTVPGQAITGETPCPSADGSSPRSTTFAQAPPTCIDATKTYTAAVETNKGSLTIALDPAAAPVAVNNFVVLARYHYYDGVPCHRIIAGFAAQCGDPTGTGSGNPGYTIAEEPPADATAYTRGVVAMAKSQGPNATGAQFFIVLSDTAGLTAEYSIIGTVTEGLDTTVAALEAAADPAANNGVPPLEPIELTSVTITEA